MIVESVVLAAKLAGGDEGGDGVDDEDSQCHHHHLMPQPQLGHGLDTEQIMDDRKLQKQLQR